MRRVSIALAAALLLAGTSAGAATDQENLAKTLDKYLSLTFPPKKGLCICTGDTATAPVKRIGLMVPGFAVLGPSTYVTVVCIVPQFDGSGAVVHPISEPCDDFVPLGK